jgi:hypothetical protein
MCVIESDKNLPAKHAKNAKKKKGMNIFLCHFACFAGKMF